MCCKLNYLISKLKSQEQPFSHHERLPQKHPAKRLPIPPKPVPLTLKTPSPTPQPAPLPSPLPLPPPPPHNLHSQTQKPGHRHILPKGRFHDLEQAPAVQLQTQPKLAPQNLRILRQHGPRGPTLKLPKAKGRRGEQKGPGREEKGADFYN